MNDKTKSCFDCMNYVPIGEGDHLCIAVEWNPRLIVEEYMPTNDFYWCKGDKFEDFPF